MVVLIAEDERTAQRALQYQLEKLGHRCLVAGDGDQAWELFLGQPVDTVISDWMMPCCDGLELCRRVRGDEDRPYVYFVMLTAADGRDKVIEAMEAGVDDYLSKPFDAAELRARLVAAERIVALHRRLAAQTAELRELNERLNASVRSDALTGVGNRRRMDEDLLALHERLRRYGQRYGAALFDVDYFKRFNDSAGHLAGDACLRCVASTIASTIRACDTVYRFGGEEFLVLLPEQDLDGAQRAAERIRTAVERRALAHPGKEDGGVVTVSGGVTAVERGRLVSPDDVIKEADAALYLAKEAGRNRVVACSQSLSAGDESAPRLAVS